MITIMGSCLIDVISDRDLQFPGCCDQSIIQKGILNKKKGRSSTLIGIESTPRFSFPGSDYQMKAL